MLKHRYSMNSTILCIRSEEQSLLKRYVPFLTPNPHLPIAQSRHGLKCARTYFSQSNFFPSPLTDFHVNFSTVSFWQLNTSINAFIPRAEL